MRRGALVAGWLAAVACGPSGAGGAKSPAPAPKPATPITTAPITTTTTVARYTPVDARYNVARIDTITFQYPNGVQTQIIDRNIWLRVIVGPGTPGAPVVIVLDSVRASLIPRDSLASSDGLRWTGTLDDGARLGPLTTTTHHALAEQLIGSTFSDLFGALPPTGARASMSWTDTTKTNELVAGSDIPVTLVRTAHASASSATPPQLRLESNSTVNGAGKSQRFGEEIGVAVTGTRYRTEQLSATGQVLGVQGRDSLALSFDLPSVGQTVPATQLGHVDIERIPASH